MDIWQNVIKTPNEFFENMPKEGGFAEPVTFAFINYFIFGIGLFILSIFYNVFVLIIGTDVNSALFSIIFWFFIFIIFFPLFAVIGLFIAGGIYQFLFKLLEGTGTYEGTVRIVSYSSAVFLVGWIPILGWLFTLYQICLNIIGGTFVHSLPTSKSAIAILIPILVIPLVMMLLSIVLSILIALIGTVL
ncbi:MAG: YIP1 family protein [Methanosarcinales archaeon]|nr:YIP1 family protein [Methanosarcinales archaeon]